MLDLKQLKYFIVCAETGSISEAAKLLYTTQPSVSKAIKALENDMGIVDALLFTGLCKSKSDARRMIVANAISVNDEKVADDKFVVARGLSKDGKILLSSGKKNKAILEI